MIYSGLALLLASSTVSATRHARDAPTSDACTQIKGAISSASAVYFPGAGSYTTDIEHWTTSSTQNATCSVEPGTTEDVAAIVSPIGIHVCILLAEVLLKD